MSGLAIKVVGLNEFRRGLKGIDAGLPKTMRGVLNEVAEDFLGWVRPKVPSRTGAARASLRAQSTQSQARIAAGGPKAEYYPWLDFGGRVGRRKSVVRPYIPDGRYIFPTLVEHRADTESSMAKGLSQLARSNGVEVS